MYMDYCRQDGTYRELKACLRDVEDHIAGVADDEIDFREIAAFRDMVGMFHDFLCENELLDDGGFLDFNRLDEICEAMKHGCYVEEEIEDDDVGGAK